ncbi:MAG TPA: heme o synthase [Thermoanaerobaculia bacterium]|nr:heme o synthase [Thermoanaerobaculia bacterium]
MTELVLETRSRTFAAVASDYLELSKARIVLMVLVTTAAGYLVAASSLDPGMLFHLLAGTALVAGGTNALNQWWERGLDGRMARTRNRPLPSGRMTSRVALAFSVGISVAGIAYLAILVNPLASLLSFATLASYLFVYTPMKTRSTLCTLVGAAPGAVPPMIGYAAATGVIDARSWSLFALMFAWQLPHFLALSWIYREDYARGGFRMLSVEDESGAAVGRQAVAWSLALLVASTVPVWLGLAGLAYALAAGVAGFALLGSAARFAFRMSAGTARTLFMGSNVYLIVVMVALVIGA